MAIRLLFLLYPKIFFLDNWKSDDNSRRDCIRKTDMRNDKVNEMDFELLLNYSLTDNPKTYIYYHFQNENREKEREIILKAWLKEKL